MCGSELPGRDKWEPKREMETNKLANQLAQISARKSGDQPNNGTALVVATSSENDEHWFDYREFAFDHEGQLELCWWSGNTIVSYLYAFEPEKVNYCKK